MSEDMLNRLNLFEALVFGIYGGWLISFVDKISFLKYPASFNIFGEAYQPVCVGLSFFCLLIFFAYSIFRPDAATKWFIYILYVGHIAGIYGALTAEGWTISNLAFFFIGTTLFIIIYLVEVSRIRIHRRNSQNNFQKRVVVITRLRKTEKPLAFRFGRVVEKLIIQNKLLFSYE